MNRILLFAFIGFTCIGSTLFGQQLPLSQQNYFNHFSLQPAYTGATEGLNTWASFRQNMMGFSNSPTSIAFNLSYRKRENHAFGTSMMSDQIGLIRNNLFNVSYAYRLKVGAKSTLSAGFSGGIGENRLDFASINIEDPSDLGNLSNNGKLMYNAGFGLAFTTPKFIIGVGLPILYSSTANYTYDATTVRYGFQPTYTANIAYKHAINPKIELVPSIIVRGQSAQQMLNDYVVTLNYAQKMGITTGYRSTGVVPIVLNIELLKNFQVYYGHEIAIGKLAHASKGGFEVGIGYKISLKGSEDNRLAQKRMLSERDSLNRRLAALNDSLQLKMTALSKLDSVQQNNENLNNDVQQLRDELRKAALEKQRQDALLKEKSAKLEAQKELVGGKNTNQSDSKSVDEEGVALDQSAGYYVIVQASVNREALEKNLLEWNEKETETFIIKPAKSKWYLIAIGHSTDKQESLKMLKEFRKKYPKAWVRQL
jgi:type IX secretion system PorP/SprF family membrane protein